VYFAFIITYFNCISYDTIAKIYHIHYDASIAEGILSGCPCVGAGAGCLLAEWLLGRMSRWNVFLVLNVCAGVGGLIVFVDDGVALLVGRLVQGLCAGMTTGVVPVMVN
jgi:MFS family permease